MAGLTIEIDKNLEQQVLAILEKYGIVQKCEAGAEAILFEELEKGCASGIFEMSHEEVWGRARPYIKECG